MKQLLIDTLTALMQQEGVDYPIALQGTLDPDENEQYPDSYITFWTNSSPNGYSFDDNVTSVEWNYSVIFYSNNPILVSTFTPKIINACKNAGFNPQGKGMDVPSGISTHTGWAMDFIYIEHTQLLN